MSDAVITETCACGASVVIRMEDMASADYAAAKWRRDHRHEFPPLAKPVRVHLPLARRRA